MKHLITIHSSEDLLRRFQHAKTQFLNLKRLLASCTKACRRAKMEALRWCFAVLCQQYRKSMESLLSYFYFKKETSWRTSSILTLDKKKKNMDYEKMQKCNGCKNVTCLQKKQVPLPKKRSRTRPVQVATSPISKVAKSFVCSVPCCRATKHDQGAETG